MVVRWPFKPKVLGSTPSIHNKKEKLNKIVSGID